jgi:hypothetical protein
MIGTVTSGISRYDTAVVNLRTLRFIPTESSYRCALIVKTPVVSTGVQPLATYRVQSKMARGLLGEHIDEGDTLDLPMICI